MKKRIMTFIAAMLLMAVSAGSIYASAWDKYTRKDGVLQNDIDRASYSIGMSLGQDFQSRGMQLNPDLIARGIRDALENNEPLMTRDEAVAALQQLQAIALAKQEEAMADLARKNKVEGEKFLAENGKRAGVMTTASGLQYEMLKAGSGRIPKASDNVSVDYMGTFIDGTEFDNSYKRGEPANFSVEGIIPGWTEALLMMKEGAKWRLYVPSALAYGTQGAPPVIGPNSVLVFEVELREILK